MLTNKLDSLNMSSATLAFIAAAAAVCSTSVAYSELTYDTPQLHKTMTPRRVHLNNLERAQSLYTCLQYLRVSFDSPRSPSSEFDLVDQSEATSKLPE
ncbi:hypothetical protein EVAR_87085_1 [Eumeta japonica]|uniref:Uncharacterized protein n=1 Tax=Eumeta variegata TaxID=151549 RepID=A0A4C1VR08_EUMVA|nr:hypothetical protein EVAR_87085_1 [Eumeta japonica]